MGRAAAGRQHRILIGIADVDARVLQGTVIDKHAQSETTSVYTGVTVFPMMPAELSRECHFAE